MSNFAPVNPPDKSVLCPKCGRSLPLGVKFCGFDGTAMVPPSTSFSSLRPVEPALIQRKSCPTCQKQFPSYAGFCPSDATRLLIVEPEYQAFQSISTTHAPVFQGASTTNAPVVGVPLGAQDDISVFSNLIGKIIDGKYVVQSVIGEGGMAVVFRAHHTVMDRPVVIKVMQGWLLANRNAVERFERECKLTAKLNHPNIVSVYDVGLINGKEPYLVMEYIKGEPLSEKIARQGALPFRTVANICIQVCRGLQEAHSVGIIHRDLKPENILLQEKTDRPDWVKIVDFGISHLVEGNKRLTKTGKMVGTPEYISPEQLKDKPIDIRADLYALGVILYEMLTGKVPFEGESPESVLMKHLLDEPPPMSQFREELANGSPFDEIVAKALKKNPDNRYQTATELRLDIEQVQEKYLLRRAPSN